MKNQKRFNILLIVLCFALISDIFGSLSCEKIRPTLSPNDPYFWNNI